MHEEVKLGLLGGQNYAFHLAGYQLDYLFQDWKFSIDAKWRHLSYFDVVLWFEFYE